LSFFSFQSAVVAVQNAH